MWRIFFAAWLGLLAGMALLAFLRRGRLSMRLRRATSLDLPDVLAWANDNIDGAGFEWAKILCEEQARFVVAVIGPLPPMTKGTPPYSVCAVAKNRNAPPRISEIPKANYGIGIK